jgi:predicted kinase
MSEIEIEAMQYFNEHKKRFLESYTKGITVSEEKTVIFTSGMSGVGKTEFAIYLKEEIENILHIDTDEIRKFFAPVGYDGQNSDRFQKVSSRGFSELFNYAMKQHYSMILDSNLASLGQAKQNIERLLKRGYNIQIVYLYNYPDVCFEYATAREVVTHRRVPKDVFIRSNENSYKTILEIKTLFKEQITLNFIDKRDDSYYQEIDELFLKEKIGENFETK